MYRTPASPMVLPHRWNPVGKVSPSLVRCGRSATEMVGIGHQTAWQARRSWRVPKMRSSRPNSLSPPINSNQPPIKLPDSPLAMCLHASSERDQPLGGTLHTPTAQALAVGLGTAAASLLASSAPRPSRRGHRPCRIVVCCCLSRDHGLP